MIVLSLNLLSSPDEVTVTHNSDRKKKKKKKKRDELTNYQ